MMQYRFATLVFACAAVLGALLPLSASAASNFEISGWLPYWRAASSTNDVLPHLSELTEINPFVFTLKSDGTLLDNGSADSATWTALETAARAQGVRVIPTVMTSNGDLIHSLLSNSTKRVALEVYLANFVKQNGFDGIDIDFEGKKAADKANFATFLKGLYARMGQKWVTCDIEARTPVDSRYYGTQVPPDAEVYANDFTAINKYCDRVKFMTYDQQGVDLQLAAQAASSSQLYAPVADPVWVAKVIDLAKQTISPNKIMIGVPTYGYEYDVTAYAGAQYDYNILWTFNPGYAIQIEQQYGVQPTRNNSGELMLTYNPVGTTTMPVATNGVDALLAATAATAYADQLNSHTDFHMLDWPDATSIAQKAQLAKDLGVRGIAIFKLDGGEDPNIWSDLNGLVTVHSGSTASSPITPTPPAAGGTTTTTSGSLPPLTRGLGLGSSGADVRELQAVLNSDPDTFVATSGLGSKGAESTYFGLGTQNAVQKFQIKYNIAQYGQAGFGYVGPATRAKLNSLIAAM